jgi:hypothetical protein
LEPALNQVKAILGKVLNCTKKMVHSERGGIIAKQTLGNCPGNCALRKGHNALLRGKTDDPTKERKKKRKNVHQQRCMSHTSPREAEMRARSHRKQKVRVTLRGQREMHKGDQSKEKNPNLQQGS